MDTREALVQAGELIKAKQYNEARAILVKLDHPLAEQWLNKVDALIAKKKRETSSEIRTVMTSPRAASEKRLTRPTSENRAARTTSSTPAVSPDKPRAKAKTTPPTIPTEAVIMGFVGMAVIGVGVLLFLSSKILYLICMSPMIAAGLAGAGLGKLLKSFKMRDWVIAGLMGAIMGVMSYGVYRVAEYFDFRESFYQDTVAEVGAIDRAEFEIYVDEMLVEETGRSGLLGFISLQADEGITITRRRSQSSFTLNKDMTIGYWGLEIIFFLVIPFALIASELTEPFCDETNEWMQFKQIGTVALDRSQTFLQLIKAGDFADAGQLMEDDRKLARTALYVLVGRCHAQSPEAIVKVKQDQGRNQKEVFKETVSAAQYNALVSAV